MRLRAIEVVRPLEKRYATEKAKEGSTMGKITGGSRVISKDSRCSYYKLGDWLLSVYASTYEARCEFTSEPCSPNSFMHFNSV